MPGTFTDTVLSNLILKATLKRGGRISDTIFQARKIRPRVSMYDLIHTQRNGATRIQTLMCLTPKPTPIQYIEY